MSNKTIWIYWHQGWDEAPRLVKQCRESWVGFNPDYEVCALDHQTLLDKVALPKGVNIRRRDLSIQKIAALGRLALLAKHGGVWTDATVMCAKPLSSWLGEYYNSQFFAFRDPGPDRLLSNWFIAAEPESIILQKLYAMFRDFFATNYFSNQDTLLGRAVLDFLGPRWSRDLIGTTFWHSWFVRKVLRVYPYYIFHYTFNKLILEDLQCRRLWFESKPLSARPPHRLQKYARKPGGIEAAKRFIDCESTPMHKLNWRVDVSCGYWKAVLQYLSATL
jgi:hypothetical protein